MCAQEMPVHPPPPRAPSGLSWGNRSLPSNSYTVHGAWDMESGGQNSGDSLRKTFSWSLGHSPVSLWKQMVPTGWGSGGVS